MPRTNGAFDFFAGWRTAGPGMLTAACAVRNGALLPADGVCDKGIEGMVAGPGLDGGAVVDGGGGSDRGADGAPVSDGGVDGKGMEGTVVAPGVGCAMVAGGACGSANGADDGPCSDDVASDNGAEGSVVGPVGGGAEVAGACGSTNGVDDCGNDIEVCGASDDEVGEGAKSPVTRPAVPLFPSGIATTVL